VRMTARMLSLIYIGEHSWFFPEILIRHIKVVMP
jgi:hypothetical protein